MILRSVWAVLAVIPMLNDANARQMPLELADPAMTIAPHPGGLKDDSDLHAPPRQITANEGIGSRRAEERGILVSQTDGPFRRSSGGIWSTDDFSVAAGSGSPAMQGLVTFAAGGARFEDCESGEIHPIATEGDFAALEHAYLAAGNEPGVSVFATFDGEVVEDMEDADEAVLVSRFVGVWPGVNCERALGEVSLTDTYWRFVSLYGNSVSMPENGKEPHMILLGADARFTATLGCNQFMGTFKLQGHGIRFGGGAASTKVACRPQQTRWEALFRDMISDVEGWKITEGELNLLDAHGKPIAELQSVSLN
jgi:heat shock protein HslJ